MVRLTLIVLLVLGLTTEVNAAECSSCKLEKGDAILCEDHEPAEKLANKLKGRIKREKDVDTKVSLLEQVAALTHAHSNAPSKNTAKVVALGLDDKRPEVRAVAARLLADGQHRAVAESKLLRADKKLEKDIDKVRDQYDKISKKIFDAINKGFKKRNLSLEELDRQKARLDQWEDERNEYDAESTRLATYSCDLGIALMQFDSEDARKSVDRWLSFVCYDAPKEVRRFVAARLSDGTREAVKAAVSALSMQQSRTEIQRKYPDQEVDPDQDYDYGDEVWNLLESFAEENDLPEPDRLVEGIGDAAEAWFKQNKDKLKAENPKK